jgi:hypothetical protein
VHEDKNSEKRNKINDHHMIDDYGVGGRLALSRQIRRNRATEIDRPFVSVLFDT